MLFSFMAAGLAACHFCGLCRLHLEHLPLEMLTDGGQSLPAFRVRDFYENPCRAASSFHW